MHGLCKTQTLRALLSITELLCNRHIEIGKKIEVARDVFCNKKCISNLTQ